MDYDPKLNNVEYGKVVDTRTKKVILYAIYDKFTFDKGGYHFGMTSHGDFCVVYFDDKYLGQLDNDIVLIGALMHELGHFINKDYENVNAFEKTIRVLCVENNLVDPKELKADRFAADQIGYKTMINALQLMKKERIRDGRAGTELAVKEFDLRIKALKERE